MSRKKNITNGIIYSTDPSFRPMEDSDGEEATLPAAQQPLRMQLETKHRGGKTVTVIYGFVGNEDDLENLGKKLKTYCGTGGSVKDREIIIQGDHRSKILDWFKKQGYAKAK